LMISQESNLQQMYQSETVTRTTSLTSINYATLTQIRIPERTLKVWHTDTSNNLKEKKIELLNVLHVLVSCLILTRVGHCKRLQSEVSVLHRLSRNILQATYSRNCWNAL
jgi:hypothetical protein